MEVALQVIVVTFNVIFLNVLNLPWLIPLLSEKKLLKGNQKFSVLILH